MSNCKCGWCELYGRFRKVSSKGTKAELRTMLSELFDMYCHESEDANYSAAILDGSWPQAVEILKRSLAKAKAIAAERKSAVKHG